MSEYTPERQLQILLVYSLFLLYLVRKEYFPFSFYSLYNDVFEIEVHLYPIYVL